MKTTRHYALLAKPSGPACNLACRYCFYLEKNQLYRGQSPFAMHPDILEAFIRQYIETQDLPEIQFSWQGGEPTLLGVAFYESVIELQKKYADGRKITNAIQTNGVLLDDRWCEFLARNGFLVGLSIDGPPELHDVYRVDKEERPTFDSVMLGLKCLKKHGVQFNTITVVHDANSERPLDVYRFLKEVGSGFMQFIPLVERYPGKAAKQIGLSLGLPPVPGEQLDETAVTEWSVKPEPFGEFYVRIFDEWVRRDVGRTFVQFFDVALANTMGLVPGLCVFAPVCGDAGVLEHNGDLYSCDHYVYPDYNLGNIMEQPLDRLMRSESQRRFGRNKLDLLPDVCLKCEVRFACNGDCPKNRFVSLSGATSAKRSLSYLCPAYKRIFRHMHPYMQIMARLLSAGQAAAGVMKFAAEVDKRFHG